MSDDLRELADALVITEERQRALDLERKRLEVSHSLTLHRDKGSAADLQAMLDHLTDAGMPPEATVSVTTMNDMKGRTAHIRLCAQWTTEAKS